MMATLAGLTVAAAPVVVVAALLRLTDLTRRRGRECVARQVALTDAIHRELGAVAAPTVRRRPGGRWLVTVALPLDCPDLVGAIVRVIDRAWIALAPAGAPPFEIVLRPRSTPWASAIDGCCFRTTEATATVLR